MVAAILGSTLLVGAVAFPLRDALTETRTVLVASIMLIVFGVVLAAVDRWAPTRTGFDATRLPVWLVVGLSQLVALVPGASRSGITMTAARLLGVERHAGARFSLLLLTPIVLAIGIVELSSVAGTEAFESVAGALMIGALTAGVVGVVVIRALLWFVATRSLLVFGRLPGWHWAPRRSWYLRFSRDDARRRPCHFERSEKSRESLNKSVGRAAIPPSSPSPQGRRDRKRPQSEVY